MIKLKKSNCDKTKKKIVTKLNNSKHDKSQTFKVLKLKILKTQCVKTQNLNSNKT